MEVGKLRSFPEVEFLKETLLQQYTGHTWEVHSCKSYRWAPLTWKKRKVEEPGERRCVFAAAQSPGTTLGLDSQHSAQAAAWRSWMGELSDFTRPHKSLEANEVDEGWL